LSISQSNEADDKQSASSHTDSFSTMGPSSPQRGHYRGEDTRLTSTKELAGFYMYGWAAEVGPFPRPQTPDSEYS
jgi:UMF1 family MFS transporter